MGHFTRCLSLADELYEVHGVQTTLMLSRDSTLGWAALDGGVRHRHRLLRTERGEHTHRQWEELLGPGDALILDIRDNAPMPDAIRHMRARGVVVAVIDDLGPRRLDADLVFYPPIQQVARLAWPGFTGKVRVGWHWVVLRRELAGITRCPSRSRVPHVLVTCGASDSNAMAMRACRALLNLAARDFRFAATFVLGAGFGFYDGMRDTIVRAAARHKNVNFDIVRNAGAMAMVELEASADLAICAFGVTAYELAALGVPAIYLCATEDHATSARALSDAGAGATLGTWFDEASIADTTAGWLHSHMRREDFARRARLIMDGRGVERVAKEIVCAMSLAPRFVRA